MLDFLIVGDGIVGSLMALKLKELNQRTSLLAKFNLSSSSSIAAGLINPVTGRHFVKSWKIEKLLAVANDIYSNIEQRHNVALIYPLEIIRAIKNKTMLNEWSSREIDPTYSEYIRTDQNRGHAKIHSDSIYYGNISGVCRIDFHEITMLARRLYREDDMYYAQNFDFTKLVRHKNYMQYDDLRFKCLICCEGALARNNPLWNWLPFVPAKGERLIIKSPQLKLKEVFNDGKVIIPLEDNKYWVGSNYEWNELNNQPTPKMYQELTSFLDRTLTVPYEVLDHSAQIRPSTYNRRPFVGAHPDHPNCYIINGLGAKGASLAPYCVEQLVEHIFEGKELDPEIDVGRV